MFDSLLGLPAHPLLLHAAVVFGPLLIAAVAGYGLVPPLRRYLGWVVVLLSVGAPLSIWFAKESGEALKRRQIANGAQEAAIQKYNEHQAFGDKAFIWGVVLGVLAIVLVLFATSASRKPATTGSTMMTWGLVVLSLVAAAFLGYYIFKTGDTGARMVWPEV